MKKEFTYLIMFLDIFNCINLYINYWRIMFRKVLFMSMNSAPAIFFLFQACSTTAMSFITASMAPQRFQLSNWSLYKNPAYSYILNRISAVVFSIILLKQ